MSVDKFSGKEGIFGTVYGPADGRRAAAVNAIMVLLGEALGGTATYASLNWGLKIFEPISMGEEKARAKFKENYNKAIVNRAQVWVAFAWFAHWCFFRFMRRFFFSPGCIIGVYF